MAEVNFKVSCPELEWEVDAKYDFPETAADCVAKFGDEVVRDGFIANAKVYLQSVGRALKRAGKNDAEVLAGISAAAPGQKRSAIKVDPKVALKQSLATMSPEEKRALLAELSEAAGV